MNHAQTAEGAHNTFLLSVLGWGLFYSVLLHFLIYFTDSDVVLKKRHLVALYFPAPVTGILFYLSAESGRIVETISRGSRQWLAPRPDIVVDSWMSVYFMVFMGTGIFLLYKSLRKSRDKTYKREAKIILAGMMISFIVGMFQILGVTKVLGVNHLWIGPNQQSVLILSVYLILFARGRKLRNETVSVPQRGAYLSAKTHENIFFYVSQAYLLSAFLSFGIEVLINNVDVFRSTILALTMFSTGYIIFILHKTKKNIKLRDNIIFSIMSVTIPFVTIYQLKSSPTFAWAIPVIFILVAVAFNNTKLLTSTAVITMGTLFSLWILRPVMITRFTGVEHFARSLIFLIVIALAYLINRIFKNRLNQFERQIDHERFISEMAMILSMARNKNLRSNLDVFLEKSVKYMDGDYGSIHIFSSKDKKIKKIEGYGRYDLVGIKNNWFFSKHIDQLMKHLAGGSLSEGEFIRELDTFKTEMNENGVTVMITPLEESGRILGVMCMGSTRANFWDEGFYYTFKLISNSLSSMLYKIRNEDELFRMAYYDALTGLPNRVLFDKIVNRLIEDTREDEMFAMIFLDLDDFKNINDLMGHSVGDRFLEELARRIEPKLKMENCMSRFGGDEFLIVLPHVKKMEEIRSFADEILNAVTTPLSVEDREVTTGASLGISIFPQDGDNSEDLIRYADLAMYISKSAGKNRYTICTEEIKSKFIMEKELEIDLYKAMVKNEFVLHYQPKVNCCTEGICGVEALIRWKHPEKGMIPPGVFLPIAERIGILPQIDDWVFIEACNQNLKWQDMGFEKISMSINITPISLMDNDFDLDLSAVFRKNRWDPKYHVSLLGFHTEESQAAEKNGHHHFTG